AYSGIRYVFLAACTDWVSEQLGLSLSGHVLSVSEASDDATKGCRGLHEHSLSLGSHSEVGISTGAAHGAFYLPRAEWLVPTLEWVHAVGTRLRGATERLRLAPRFLPGSSRRYLPL